MSTLVHIENISEKIYVLRGLKVILDLDLAKLYGVETKQLKRQVRRNIKRFPDDFMLALSTEEYQALRSQIGTLKRGGHSKYPPMAFTEHGAIMAASVLNSPRAIETSVFVVRAFVKMREMLYSSRKFAVELEDLEKRLSKHDKNFQVVFQALDQLLHEDKKLKRKIGF